MWDIVFFLFEKGFSNIWETVHTIKFNHAQSYMVSYLDAFLIYRFILYNHLFKKKHTSNHYDPIDSKKDQDSYEFTNIQVLFLYESD